MNECLAQCATRSTATRSVAQRAHAAHTRLTCYTVHTQHTVSTESTSPMCVHSRAFFVSRSTHATHFRCSYRMGGSLVVCPVPDALCLASEQRYAAFLWGSARGARGFLDGLRLPSALRSRVGEVRRRHRGGRRVARLKASTLRRYCIRRDPCAVCGQAWVSFLAIICSHSYGVG